MATIGPIVRNEVFFFVVILGAAALAGAARMVRTQSAADSRAMPRIRPSDACWNGNFGGSGVEFCGGDSVRRWSCWRWRRSLFMRAA